MEVDPSISICLGDHLTIFLTELLRRFQVDGQTGKETEMTKPNCDLCNRQIEEPYYSIYLSTTGDSNEAMEIGHCCSSHSDEEAFNLNLLAFVRKQLDKYIHYLWVSPLEIKATKK